jgi:hypothetical protein
LTPYASIRSMPIKRLIALSLILAPGIVLGQLQTPAEQAEVAVRARVTEFLQYHVEGNFRKAYDMVAEDTKDEYFGSGKAQLTSFHINDVKLSDNLTKATVTASISKMVMIVGQEIPMTTLSTTTWKIENGKWVWYNDAKPGTLMDPGRTSLPSIAHGNNTGNAGLPDANAIASAAQSILQQVGVDKKQVTLAVNKVSEDRVVFHNGMPGSVQLQVNGPDVPGFSAKVDQPYVRAGGDVPVVFRYEPGDSAGRRDPITVQLVVQPLNQAFMIEVNFSAAGPATQK